MASKTRLTRADLSRRWGVSRQAVTALFVKPGAPAFDAEGRVSVAAAERFRNARAAARADGGEYRQKLYRLRAMLLQIELDRMQESLISREDVREQAKIDAALMKSSLLSMADTLAPAIVGLTNTAAVQTLLKDWARSTLQSWSDAVK
jgi:hypothetical protein